MTTTIGDIVRFMHDLAPPGLAEDWDNPGLHVGAADWPVRKIWTALDPLPEIVEKACQNQIDLLITHHPLIFKPLTAIDASTAIGKIIEQALTHRLGIFSAHTNLDVAKDGINDILAERIGMRDVRPLRPNKSAEYCKIAIFVPKEYERRFLNALFETHAGKIGDYSCCSFRYPGKGTFKPSAASTPFIGETEKVNEVEEIRMEAMVSRRHIPQVLEHLKRNHPYETMAYDIYPLEVIGQDVGLGRIGNLETSMRLHDFALDIKEKLGLSFLKIAGSPDLRIDRAAICSGSGSSMLKDFYASGAHVFISGDIGYHNALDVKSRGLAVIDIGHFESEHIIVDVLTERLNRFLSQKRSAVQVVSCETEKTPFTVL